MGFPAVSNRAASASVPETYRGRASSANKAWQYLPLLMRRRDEMALLNPDAAAAADT
ncbi:hypothetical protein [Methylobacterium sp. XJLW]|uniref:hypothetical protein n=1 Tax=Methylobacterium sp. XJLW TaxID=739141 RepID=UPI00197C9F12|nr:hypothetical protein [Methylobacterium sp. XJLW]